MRPERQHVQDVDQHEEQQQMSNVYVMLASVENDGRRGTPMRRKSVRRMMADKQRERNVGQLGE